MSRTRFCNSSSGFVAWRLAIAILTLASAAVGTSNAAPHEPKKEPAESESAEDDARLRVYEEIEVKDRADDLLGVAESANEGSTGARDLAKRPLLRSGEIIETVPGVIATQHSGGGKANQYFVRGFNLDHGTDLSITAAGVPVNMPSHGHGQGYADLSFLIPEVIDRVRYRKGPFFAEKGDFSAAAATDVDFVGSLPEGLLRTTGGSYGYGRVLVADSFRRADGDLLAALELLHDDGPARRGNDYRRVNSLIKYSRGDGARGWSLTTLGYSGSWLSADQVPQRAVDAGLIDRFGLIDAGPRGESDRYSLSGELHRGDETSLSRLTGYLLFYDLQLVSNFTYLLTDPVNGDQFEQMDRRWVGGLDLNRQWLRTWKGRPVETSAGLQLRYDDIENGLFHTRDLERIGTVREDAIQLLTGGPYASATVRWREKVRTSFGLRTDVFSADVESDLAANSGTADDVIVSPKLGLVLGPWKKTEIYANLGYGFHSNDARGATLRIDPVTHEPSNRVEPLVRALGVDLGFRTSVVSGLQTTLSAFLLKLDSELVFVGDGGSTEASRPSRRIGVEWTNHYHVAPKVALNLDVALSKADFTDEDPVGDHIPGALETVVAAALSVEDVGRWSGTLRLRYFSGYPLIEDDSVRAGATTLLNGWIGYKISDHIRVHLEGFNLLDRNDSEIEYFYASRLPGEPAEGIEDVHFKPVEPISARLVLTMGF